LVCKTQTIQEASQGRLVGPDGICEKLQQLFIIKGVYE